MSFLRYRTLAFLVNIARAISRRRGSPLRPALQNKKPASLLAGFLAPRSAAQTEPADQCLVAFGVRALEVVEQLATAADHLKQAATRVVVFRVGLEVPREFDDARGEQRNLDF